jgi:hypothetical protein
MLKHLETVQTMSRNFGSQAWLHYGRGFRWAMQHNPAIQWGSLDVELYMQATALGLKGERNYGSNYSRPSQRRTDKLSGPPKTCWRFYRDDKCPHKEACYYQDTHHCTKCQGAHATTQCTQGDKESSPGKKQPFRGDDRKGDRSKSKQN